MGHTKVEGDELDLSSRAYQNNTYDNIIKILFYSDYNRYAAVIFPTGGGKSYMAYGLMQYMAQKENLGKEQLKVLFISPTEAINEQFKDKAENVLSTSKKDDRIKLDTVCYAANEEKIFSGYDLIIFDEAHRSSGEKEGKWAELVKNIIEKNPEAKIFAMTATPERSDEITPIEEIAGLIYGEDKIPPRKQYMAGEIYLEDALRDGIVVAPKNFDWDMAIIGKDEFKSYLQNIGALFKNIDNNSELNDEEKEKAKEKIIAPLMEAFESDDEYGKNASGKLKTLTKFNEIITGNTIDINGPLMREYMMLNHMIQNPSGETISKEEIENRLKKLEDEMFYGLMDFRTIAAGMQENRIKLLQKSFEGVNNGIFVASIDSFAGNLNKFYDGKDADYIESEKIRIEYELKKALNCGIEIYYADDKDKVKEIENANKEGEKIHVVLSKKILDEGIHMDGTKGVLMYSKTNSEIVFSQRIGRTIHSPNKEDMIRPVVVDFAGNRYNYLLNNYSERFSPEYDLTVLKEIEEWIKNNERVPDVNKEYQDNSIEVRYGLVLKSIINRYTNMNNFGFNSAINEIKQKIAELENGEYKITSEKLERKENLEPSEKEILGKDFFEFNPLQSIIVEYKENIETRNKDDYRIKKLLNILNIIKKYKPDIHFPSGFIIKDEIEDFEKFDLKEFLEKNFPNDEERSKILKDLVNYTVADEEIGIDAKNKKYTVLREKNGVLEDYDLGEEIAYVRGLFLTSGQKELGQSTEPPITKYSLALLRELGITEMMVKINFGESERRVDILDIVGCKKEKHLKNINLLSGILKGIVPKIKMKLGRVNEDGFLESNNENEEENTAFYISKNSNKNSKSDNFVRIHSKFNDYSWITGIKYGPSGLDKNGNMSQELIDAREFIGRFIYQEDDNGDLLDINQVLENVLAYNPDFREPNGKLNIEKARGYIEKCIVNSMKFYPKVFYEKDERKGLEFEGVDYILDSTFSSEKKDRIELLGKEFPEFKMEYSKYLEDKIEERKKVEKKESKKKEELAKKFGSKPPKYQRIKESLEGDER